MEDVLGLGSYGNMAVAFGLGVLCSSLTLIVFLVVVAYLLLVRQPSPTPPISSKRPTKITVGSRLSPTEVDICKSVSYVAEPTVAESCGWINVLMAQIIHHCRQSQEFHDVLLKKLHSELNGPKRPSFLSPIEIDELSFGSQFPKLDAAAVRPIHSKSDSRLVTEISFSYKDNVQIGLSTQILLNLRNSLIGSLPVSIIVSLKSISGLMMIECEDNAQNGPTISFCFKDNFSIEFDVNTSLGETSKIKDIPKLTTLITRQLQRLVRTMLVYPKKQTFPLIKLVKKSENGNETSKDDNTEEIFEKKSVQQNENFKEESLNDDEDNGNTTQVNEKAEEVQSESKEDFTIEKTPVREETEDYLTSDSKSGDKIGNLDLEDNSEDDISDGFEEDEPEVEEYAPNAIIVDKKILDY